MFGVLSRVPVSKQRPVAGGLLYVAMMTALFGFLSVGAFSETTTTSGALWWKKTRELSQSERLPWLLAAIGLLAVAILCTVASIRLFTMHGSLKKYPPIFVGVESMRIQQIADITNTSTSKVYRDLQAMIDSGMISDFYIDYKAEQVVSKKYIPERSHKTVVTCSGCGGNNELIVGITKACSFCGQPLLLKRA